MAHACGALRVDIGYARISTDDQILALLRGELEPVRSREITAKLMAAGLPI